MPKTIQLRNVPESLHRKLKARAAEEGMSLSDYLLGEVRRAADRPSISELRQRLAARAQVRLAITAARAVRAERNSH
jgi:plasmid stability protein